MSFGPFRRYSVKERDVAPYKAFQQTPNAPRQLAHGFAIFTRSAAAHSAPLNFGVNDRLQEVERFILMSASVANLTIGGLWGTSW